jgi:GDP-L-fucose synthase
MQMLGIQYTWYGAGFVDYMIRGSDGNWVFAHRIKNNNVNTIINCSAKVGGVQANMKNNKGFFIENFMINNNVIESSFKNEIPNFVNLLSTCIFPDKNIIFPLTPNQIDNGEPHYSNHGYAYAKRIAGYQTSVIKKVLNANWISLIPTNVYGINDNFHLDEGHMIPGMIHRAYLSKQNSEKMVVWGDGSPLRQVIHSDDLAKLILWSLDNWRQDEPFMAINPNEHSILEISNIICKTLEISDDEENRDSNLQRK